MISFLTVIASPAVSRVAEKSFFGKPHVRIGRLFGVVGFWVYQQGGVLGYALRDYPRLLGKLAIPPSIIDGQRAFSVPDEQEIINELKDLRKVVASQLEQVKDQDKNFIQLCTLRELRDIGIELMSWPPNKALDKKVDASFAGNVMRIAFVQGISLGFHFPEQFASYWDNTYKMMPASEWKRMHERGIVRSEIQKKLSMDEAIVEIAETAISWGTEEAQELLNNQDIDTLQALIYMHKEK